MTTTVDAPNLPTQADADATPTDAGTTWLFQCRACPTATPDAVTASFHSLAGSDHICVYAPSGTINP